MHDRPGCNKSTNGQDRPVQQRFFGRETAVWAHGTPLATASARAVATTRRLAAAPIRRQRKELARMTRNAARASHPAGTRSGDPAAWAMTDGQSCRPTCHNGRCLRARHVRYPRQPRVRPARGAGDPQCQRDRVRRSPMHLQSGPGEEWPRRLHFSAQGMRPEGQPSQHLRADQLGPARRPRGIGIAVANKDFFFVSMSATKFDA